MASGDSISRKTHMLRIYNPDDSSQFVDVKIIDQISFIVPEDQNWEYQYNFLNYSDAVAGTKTQRQIRSQVVMGTLSTYTNNAPGKDTTVQNDPTPSGDKVTVERIMNFPHIVEQEQFWERQWVLNGNEESNEPTPKHYKTHRWKVTGTINGNQDNGDGTSGTPDDTTYVVMQRMDTLDALVPVEQSWEYQHLLNWPDDDVSNPDSTVDKSYSPDNFTSSNPAPAYRFDPLQNLVDVRWGGLAVEFGEKDQDSPAYVPPSP